MKNFLVALAAFLGMSQILFASTTIVEWNFPNNPDDATADGGISANSSQSLSTSGTGTVTYSSAGAATRSADASGWNSGSGTKYWMIQFSTQNYNQFSVSSKQWSSTGFLQEGPRDFKIQYRVGVGGTWTDVSGGTISVGNNFSSGVVSNLSLPSSVDNQSSVFLRWIMTSNTSVSGSGVDLLGTSRIDDIIVTSALDGQLPVELSSFRLTQQKEKILLEWETASEENNAGFEVYRSEENSSAEKISFQKISSYQSNPGLTGLGTNPFGKKYFFTDEQIRSGKKYFYKLVDVDFSGRRTEHDPKEIFVEEISGLNFVFTPNPVINEGKIFFRLENNQELSSEIYSLAGEKVVSVCERKNFSSGENFLSFTTENISSGMYYIQFRSEGKILFQRNFIIQ